MEHRMKQVFQEYRDIFKTFFLKNKASLLILALVCVLGYGFTITHYSIGVDNNAHELYYVQGGAISQGRITQVLLDILFGAYTYPPFWVNALSVIVLYFSSLMWCILFKRVGGENINSTACTIFSTVLVSYPIINEHFIFLPLDFPLGYGLTAMALMGCHEAFSKKNLGFGVLASILMVFVISLNESFAAVFLAGMLMIFMLEIIFGDNLKNAGQIVKKMLSFAAVLLIAVVCEWALLRIIQLFYQPEVAVGAANTRIFWLDTSALVIVKNLFWGLISKYAIIAKTYLPIFVLLLACGIILISTIYWAIKKKRPVLFILLLLMYLSIVSLNIVKGGTLPYRTDSALAVFVGFSMMLLWITLGNKRLRVIYGILIIILVINQTRVLNNWFYNDYKRYERDLEIEENISNEIETYHDASKPILFIGWVENSPDTRTIPGEYNGVQYFNQYSNYREKANPYSYLLLDFFRIHGHAFTDATEEYYEEGREIAEDMPSYPKPGYIKEEEEYIIVNFN